MGEFKTERISFRSQKGENKTGRIQSCIQYYSVIIDANSEILHCSGAFARRHKHCKPECSFMQTRVDHFLLRKDDVISPLRHSYTKDPLCVTRLILYHNITYCKCMTTHSLSILQHRSIFGNSMELSNANIHCISS